jgi:hypothetical protein
VTAFAWTADGAEVASLTLTASDAIEATRVAGDAVGTVFMAAEPATAARSVLRLWDAGGGRLLREWQPPAPPLVLAFSPDGRGVAVATTAGLVLWEKASNRERWRCPAVATALAFSPDGRLLASGEGSEVRVRDASGREVACFAGHQASVRALSFTPDGRALVSAGADSTALVWDVAGLRPAAPPAGEALSVAASWDDLRGEDAVRAYRAVIALAGAPGQAVPALRERLRPVGRPEAHQVEGRLADLDADTFEARDRAGRELAALGAMVRPQLEKALEGKPSPEKRRRLRALLEALEPGAVMSGEDLRQVRAVEVLERAATPEARRLLGEWAGGAPGALLTREARAALGRLGR